jgi:hypothetical protein
LAFPQIANARALDGGYVGGSRATILCRVMAQSYESSRAALDDIIRRYRAGRTGDGRATALSREQAIELIKALGFTRGDALRWLDSKPPRP